MMSRSDPLHPHIPPPIFTLALYPYPHVIHTKKPLKVTKPSRTLGLLMIFEPDFLTNIHRLLACLSLLKIKTGQEVISNPMPPYSIFSVRIAFNGKTLVTHEQNSTLNIQIEWRWIDQ